MSIKSIKMSISVLLSIFLIISSAQSQNRVELTTNEPRIDTNPVKNDYSTSNSPKLTANRTESESFGGEKTIIVDSGDQYVRLSCPAAYGKKFQTVIWIFEETNTLIGAGALYNFSKYRYLASTGELLILEVEHEDSGVYKCLIRKLVGESSQLELSTVELYVTHSYSTWWEQAYHDNKIMTWLTGGLVVGTFSFILLAFCCSLGGSGSSKTTSRNQIEISAPRPPYKKPSLDPILEVPMEPPNIPVALLNNTSIKKENQASTVLEELEEKFHGNMNLSVETESPDSNQHQQVETVLAIHEPESEESDGSESENIKSGVKVVGVNTDHRTIVTSGTTIIYVTAAD